MPPRPKRDGTSNGRTNGRKGSADVGFEAARLPAQTSDRLTTSQGLRLPDTDHSLKAGERGPTLLEDFHFREKITHFDHERIPERVVHARGTGAAEFGDRLNIAG